MFSVLKNNDVLKMFNSKLKINEKQQKFKNNYKTSIRKKNN